WPAILPSQPWPSIQVLPDQARDSLPKTSPPPAGAPGPALGAVGRGLHCLPLLVPHVLPALGVDEPRLPEPLVQGDGILIWVEPLSLVEDRQVRPRAYERDDLRVRLK